MNCRVLIVEDEPDSQEVMVELLSFADIVSTRVNSAEAALKLLDQQGEQFCGVVIDLALPGMNGFALLEAIRNNKHYAHLPCIAVTAYHTSTVRHDTKMAGFDGYFPKPFDETSFAEDVKDVITQTA